MSEADRKVKQERWSRVLFYFTASIFETKKKGWRKSCERDKWVSEGTGKFIEGLEWMNPKHADRG